MRDWRMNSRPTDAPNYAHQEIVCASAENLCPLCFLCGDVSRRTNIYINWLAGVSGMFNTFEFPDELEDQLPAPCLKEIQNRDSLSTSASTLLPRTRYDRLEARAKKWLLPHPDGRPEGETEDSHFVGVLECTAASLRQLLLAMGFEHDVRDKLDDADVRSKVANRNNLATLSLDVGDERDESTGQ